jgi:hypothetical protein
LYHPLRLPLGRFPLYWSIGTTGIIYLVVSSIANSKFRYKIFLINHVRVEALSLINHVRVEALSLINNVRVEALSTKRMIQLGLIHHVNTIVLLTTGWMVPVGPIVHYKGYRPSILYRNLLFLNHVIIIKTGFSFLRHVLEIFCIEIYSSSIM